METPERIDAVAPVRVDPWPSEGPLLVLVLVVSFVFVSRLIFIAHLRGSAVRLGPGQFLELYRRVEDLARRIGLPKMPAVYLMQAGGALNALATRFFASTSWCCFRMRLRWLLFPGLCVPFDGNWYGYRVAGDGYYIWSTGLDQ